MFFNTSFSWIALYLYKSTIKAGMVYCYNTWTGAPNCYLHMLYKLKKWVWRNTDPSFTASLEPLAHCQNVTNLSLSNWYYLGRCSSEQVELVLLLYSRGISTCCFNRLHNFSTIIPRCYENVYVNSFFFPIAKIWNSLPSESFPLTYDLNGFKSRIDWRLLFLGSF